MRLFDFSYRTRQSAALALLMAVIFWQGAALCPADAKKKKDAGVDVAAEAAKQEAALKKELDPVNKQINDLMVKMQSRGLFSPTDAGKLTSVRFKLFDIISQYPAQPILAGPAYQAGLLLSEREEFHNAYELFSFVAESFPQHAYGLKAKSQIQQLERRLGANYFPKELGQTLVSPKPDEKTAAKPEKK